MGKDSIPQLHATLEKLNTFFKDKTALFCRSINQTQGTFTESDYSQFTTLVEDIKQYATTSIEGFFQRKLDIKCEPFESTILQYSNHSEMTCDSLREFREELQESTLELKQKQQRKEVLLEHLSTRFIHNNVFRKVWNILHSNAEEGKNSRRVNREMDGVYHRNLLKKAFFPWRRLTYREGYESTVRRETSEDLMQIHSQYQSIIDILKDKIHDTEDTIKVKRVAKGEFSYALSKNLLKTISNLSMEVMTLNQMTLSDGQTSEAQTREFMLQVNGVIDQKLTKVRQFKHTMCQTRERGGTKKGITFV